MLEEDRSHAPMARHILKILDEGLVQNEADFVDLSQMVNDYKAEALIGKALSYKFKEPMGVDELFGDPKVARDGRLVITKGGRKVEINEVGEVIGPVTELSDPAPGHPEYDGPESVPLTPSSDPEVLVGNYMPFKERRNLEMEQEMSKYIAAKQSQLQDLSLLKAAKTGSTVLDSPPRSHSGHYAPIETPPLQLKPLEILYLNLKSLGKLAYEPEEIIKTKLSLNLIFDPSRAKPAFIPEAGQFFEAEWKNAVYYVAYMGNTFEYNGRILLCFGVVPRLPKISKETEEEPYPSPQPYVPDFEETLEAFSKT